MRVPAALCALVCATPFAVAAEFYAEGSFVVGNPVALLVIDACGTQRATQGIDSSCIDLPLWIVGRGYLATFEAVGHNELVGGGSVCFYDDIQFLTCHQHNESASVPIGATRASFTSLVGAQVEWTFRV